MTQSTQNKFQTVGDYEPNHPNMLRKVANNLKGIMSGKTNNTGSITLTTSAATTTVTLAAGLLTNTTVINFMPTTANAAGELATMYISLNADASPPTFTINHANNTQNDRTFRYVFVG